MGVPEAADKALETRAVLVGRVRVVVVVAVLVVAAVHADPVEDCALGGHAAGDGPEPANRRGGLEGAVGEKAVVADGDAQPGDEVESQEEPQVDHPEAAAPGEDHGGDEAHDGEDDSREGRDAFAGGHGGGFDIGPAIEFAEGVSGLGEGGDGAGRGGDLWRHRTSCARGDTALGRARHCKPHVARRGSVRTGGGRDGGPSDKSFGPPRASGDRAPAGTLAACPCR